MPDNEQATKPELAEGPMFATPLTEDWLKASGFKWEQHNRQPVKHWVLWLGDALMDAGEPGRKMFSSYEDLGIEVAKETSRGWWFCWLRSDSCHRYHRFLHIRHLSTVEELVTMIEGLTGRQFRPQDCLYGSFRTPEDAERIRLDDQRFDRSLMREGAPWTNSEKDEFRGRPTVVDLPENKKD